MGPTVRGKWNSVLYQIFAVLCAMLSDTDVCVYAVFQTCLGINLLE